MRDRDRRAYTYIYTSCSLLVRVYQYARGTEGTAIYLVHHYCLYTAGRLYVRPVRRWPVDGLTIGGFRFVRNRNFFDARRINNNLTCKTNEHVCIVRRKEKISNKQKKNRRRRCDESPSLCIITISRGMYQQITSAQTAYKGGRYHAVRGYKQRVRYGWTSHRADAARVVRRIPVSDALFIIRYSSQPQKDQTCVVRWTTWKRSFGISSLSTRFGEGLRI